jgi:excisionase family DNA binding protein
MSTPRKTSRLLTIAEACERTGLKEPTMRLKVYRRQIDYHKLGRAVRIPESAIEKLIADSMVPALER